MAVDLESHASYALFVERLGRHYDYVFCSKFQGFRWLLTILAGWFHALKKALGTEVIFWVTETKVVVMSPAVICK